MTSLVGAAPVRAATPAGGGQSPPSRPSSSPRLHGQEFPLKGTPHRLCPKAKPGHVACGVIQLAIVGSGTGLGPNDLRSAYNLPPNGGSTLVAVVDAYDDPTAESDLATYRSNFGLPSCTSASGCFTKVNQTGGSSYPPPDNFWASEISLDLDAVSATCQTCRLLLVEANSTSQDDIGASVDEAVALGAKVVSLSYAGPEFSTETNEDVHYNHAGVSILAGAGDDGYAGGVMYPAASKYTIAVGGTTLRFSSGKGWTESAWSGVDSGCSAYESKPSWQHDTGCANRTVADVAAVANPYTPLSVYDSYNNSGWILLGGTSAATPVVAGVMGLSGNSGVFSGAANTWYTSAYSFPPAVFDVVSGSDGSCSPAYLCNSGTGYDGPTGLGTPDGVPPSPSGPFGGLSGSGQYGSGNPGSAERPPCACGDPVNSATGNLIETATDLSVPGRGRALNFTRTYNAQDAATATGPDALGWGWTDSYADSLSINSTNGNVTVHQDNGSTTAFTDNAGTYSAAPWINASLVKNPDGTYTYTLADLTSDNFSSTGQLLSESDRNGYLTTLSYSGSQLTSVTDPAGRKLSFGYTGGQLTSVTDPANNTVTYAYDASGNLASVTDPAGNKTLYGYDASHRLTTITLPNGGVTTNTYDTSNRVITQVDPVSHKTTWSYSGSTTTITDPNGNVRVETYDNDALVSITRGYGSPQAATWTYTYDQAYNQTSVTDPNGNTTRTTYDFYGNPVAITSPLGELTTNTYDAANDLTSITDPDDETTSFTYEAHHDLASASRPLYTSGPFATTSYSYDPAHPGDVTSITDPDGNPTTFAYDTYGNLASETTQPSPGIPDTTAHTYDIDSRLVCTASPDAIAAGVVCPAAGQPPVADTTSYLYDPDGHVTQITSPTGAVTTRSYDPDQNLASLTDPDNNKTTYSYDLADQLTTIKRADNTTLGQAYDGDGNLASQTDGAGNPTTYTYDPLDRLSSVTDPDQRTTTYTYDGAGNRLTLTDPTGNVTYYGYDPDNHLTGIQYSGGTTPSVSYSYDPDGRRMNMYDGSGTTSYTYDALGRLIQSADGNGAGVSYNYDLKGQLTSLVYPGNKTVFRNYDGAGRLTSVSDWLGNTTNFSYDPDGNLTNQAYPNGVTASIGYDQADESTSVTDTEAGQTLAGFSYTRDPAEQLTSTTPSGATAQSAQTYGYNKLNQLAQVTTLAGNVTATDQYDKADNITKLGNLQLSYDPANQLLKATNGTTGLSTTYAYDNQGNRISASPLGAAAVSYGYDQANQLTSVAGVASYTYNGDGLRMTKSLVQNGATTAVLKYSWDLSATIPLLLTDGTNDWIYGPNNTPLEQVGPNNTVLYLHQDQLGSTRLVTDSHGLVAGTASYDTYGRPVSTTGTAIPLGFAGQYTDSETGFIYLINRYYDPATANFLNRDPLFPETRSPYGYISENPLNGTDPDGLCFIGLFGKHCHIARTLGLIGAVVAGVSLIVVTGGAAIPAYAVTAGTISTYLGIGSFALGTAGAVLDCRKARDIQCAADIAGAFGGLVTAGGGYVLTSESSVLAALGIKDEVAGHKLLQGIAVFFAGQGVNFGVAPLYEPRLCGR